MIVAGSWVIVVMNGVSKALIFLVLMTAYIALGLAETVLQLRRRFVEIRQEKLAQAAAAPRRPPTRRRATKRSCASSAPSTTRPKKPEHGDGAQPNARRARPRPSACSCRPPRRRRRRPRRMPPQSAPTRGPRRIGSSANGAIGRRAQRGGQRDVDAAEQLAPDPVEPRADAEPEQPLERRRPERVLAPRGLPADHPDQAADERVGHERRGTAANAELERRPPERSADDGTLEKTENDARMSGNIARASR